MIFCKYGGSKLVRELQPNSKYCTRVRMYEYSTIPLPAYTCMKDLESTNIFVSPFYESILCIRTWYPHLTVSTLACIHTCLYPLLSLSSPVFIHSFCLYLYIHSCLCICSYLHPLRSVSTLDCALSRLISTSVNIHSCLYPLLSISTPILSVCSPFCIHSCWNILLSVSTPVCI